MRKIILVTRDMLINPKRYKRLIISLWLIMEAEFRILILRILCLCALPFLLGDSFKCALLKEVTNNVTMYTKINKQNHEQIKIKLCTLKRSSFFV